MKNGYISVNIYVQQLSHTKRLNEDAYLRLEVRDVTWNLLWNRLYIEIVVYSLGAEVLREIMSLAINVQNDTFHLRDGHEDMWKVHKMNEQI